MSMVSIESKNCRDCGRQDATHIDGKCIVCSSRNQELETLRKQNESLVKAVEELLKELPATSLHVSSDDSHYHSFTTVQRVGLGGVVIVAQTSGVSVKESENWAKFIASAPATISKLVQSVRELRSAIDAKDAAIKCTLAYLRSDDIDLEVVAGMINDTLTKPATK